MKRKANIIFLCAIMLGLVTGILSGQSDELIVRSVTILPFVNESKSGSNDYIGDVILSDLQMQIEERFYFIETNEVIPDLFGTDIAGSCKKAEVTALKIEADTVIFGKYNVSEKEAVIDIYVYDVILQSIILSMSTKTGLGLELIKNTGALSLSVGERLFDELTAYKSGIIEKLRSSGKETAERKALIDGLFSQDGKLWRIKVKRKGYEELVNIPFGRNVVIFVCEESGNYNIETGGKRNSQESNIKVMDFMSQVGAKRIFKITGEKIRPAFYSYVQKKDYDVDIKYVSFSGSKEIGEHSFYVDNSFSFSTSGCLGYDLKLGLGLPMNSGLENSIYFKFMGGPKVFNAVETKSGINLDYPHLKLRVGLGFEHIFYIKNLLGIQMGVEVGGEFNFFAFIISNKDRISVPGQMIFGCPSIYYSFPVGLQFFVTSNVGMFFGVEPILRLVVQSFIFDGKVFFQNLDGTRGAGFSNFRVQSEFLTVDLFLYDMPIYIGLRIKI
jgi:hypothetical protein